MATPVFLFLRKSAKGPIWYAKIHDDATGETLVRSTGILAVGRGKSRTAAENKARSMLGAIARRRDPLFLEFIASFWAEDSRYVRMKAAEGVPLSRLYVHNSRRTIRLHVEPFEAFAGLRLSKLRRGVVDDWKLWAIERGTGRRTINYALQAMKVPLNDALNRGDIAFNPLATVKPVRCKAEEKGLLTSAEAAALATFPERDERVRLAVLLALFGGLRRGECRGLQWGDIDEAENVIDVRHNWTDEDGLKQPKSGSFRRIFLHKAVKEALKAIQTRAFSDYVLFDPRTGGPISEQIVKDGFVRMVRGIGISNAERKARRIQFHGLRHQFVTDCLIAGMKAAEAQALAGHKTSRMMDRYAHGGQVIDLAKARATMEAAGAEKAAND